MYEIASVNEKTALKNELKNRILAVHCSCFAPWNSSDDIKCETVTRRAGWLILGSKSNTVSEMYASGRLATYRYLFVENVNF